MNLPIYYVTYMQPKPIVLIILDGFGIRKPTTDNAITTAHTPIWNQWWQQAPHTTLLACGQDVGLPEGQMGNSEVGHLTIGAGRVIDQDLTRIDRAIQEGYFNTIPALQHLFKVLHKTQRTLHIIGLLSEGGVHSHEKHIHACIEAAVEQGVKSIVVHAFLDGRDTPPKSAKTSLLSLQTLCLALEQAHQHSVKIKIGSLCGRYYAMDRDKRFERTFMAYTLLRSPSYPSLQTTNLPLDPIQTLEAAYAKGETDEFVSPVRLESDAWIHDDDAVIFMNFRSDRARQLSHALAAQDFQAFTRPLRPIANFCTLTEYDKELKATALFPPQPLTNMFGAILEQHHLKQLRIAETEKYAHVTFFFNGGRETPFEGEERILIPSPKVSTYDKEPEMSAIPLTDALLKAITSKKYDVIICNYANADMLGHTGNFSATVKAIEVLDQCLERVIETVGLMEGELIITADHGNAECMLDSKTGQPHTAHTNEPVPFVYIGHSATLSSPMHNGKLSDLAPTLLTLLKIAVPKEMTGHSLLTLKTQNDLKSLALTSEYKP